MSGSAPTPSPSKGRAATFLADSPLGIRPYRLLYIGAVTTSMAYTMQSAMAGWLMASLSGSALLLAMVAHTCNPSTLGGQGGRIT